MTPVPLKIKKLHPEAVVPAYQSFGAACFDLHAATMEDPLTYGTGLAFEIPEGHVMLVFSRSGHGFKFGSHLANAVGVIDSDYRGEVKVKFNSSNGCYPGDRIAQAMVLPIPSVQFIEVEEISDTVRGEGGFGSTGV